ncbi:hypothetical protein ETD83_21690 [Actinomadura soli]|uniref:AAA+ ATPase domain-containing protein n=1 Tax=Actinomadura soli TaxID=2508997 RepID=A0A5C4J9A5_9ACTN|nr:PEP-CTERM sorting domain-containing protein [Actinomadura soli]TMQ96183.1 hypothetical protein ETD83_21690 [Actinomadura soli]
MTNDPPPQQPPEPEEPLEQILADFLNLMDEANQLLLPDEEVERRLRRLTGGEFPDADAHGREIPAGDPGDRVPGERDAASGDLDLPALTEPEDCSDATCVDPSVWRAAEEIKAAAREEAARIRAAAQREAKQILDDAKCEAEDIKVAAREWAVAIERTAQLKAEDYEDKGIRKAAKELMQSRQDAERIRADAERVLDEARDEADRIIELAEAHASGRIAGAQEAQEAQEAQGNAWHVRSATGLAPPPHLGSPQLRASGTAAGSELVVYKHPPVPATTTITPSVSFTSSAPLMSSDPPRPPGPPGPPGQPGPSGSSGPAPDDEAAHDIELVDDETDIEDGDGEHDRLRTAAGSPGTGKTNLARSAGLWGRPRSWPSRGSVHCPMVAASAINAGHDKETWRGDGLLRYVRDSLYQIMRDSFDRVGIGWAACRSYDRGDSLLILVPPDVMPELLANALVHGTRAGLRRHNRLSSDLAQLGIRMAVHQGIVHFDEAGATGWSLELLYRLLDSTARPGSGGGVVSGEFGLVTSAYMYENVLRHYSELMNLDDFQPMRLRGEKDFQAWGYFPSRTGRGRSPSPPDTKPDANVYGRVMVGDHEVQICQQGTVVAVRTRFASRVRRRIPHVDCGTPPSIDRPLVGRYEELARLAAWLDAGEPVLVCGPPGVGKSALLRFFTGQRVAAGADVVSMSAAGMGADDVVHALFRRCYDADDHRPEPERLRSLMSTVGALVVVDDFAGSAEDAEALADLVSGGAMIIIARDRIEWERGRLLELSGLPEGASRALLDAELGDRVWHGDAAAAWKLSRSSRGNPRALLQAVAATRTGAVAALPTRPDDAVRTLWHAADPDVRAVLRVLCVLDGVPVAPGLLIRLAEVSDGRKALNDLLWTRLAQRAGPGYVATFAPGMPVPGPDRSPADFVDPLTRWVADVPPGQVAESAAVVIAVLADAVRVGAHVHACALARVAAPALGVTLWWGAWARVLSLGGDAARLAGAADDAAYFDGEERMRLLVLGSMTGPEPDDDADSGGVGPGPGSGPGAGPPGHGGGVPARSGRRARLASCGLITVVVAALVVVGVFCASLFGYGLFGDTEPSGKPPSTNASMRTSPTQLAGADSTVQVTGFSPGEQVWFVLAGSPAITLAIVTMRRDGQAIATIRQQSSQGRYTVLAVGMTSGRIARTDIRLV